MAGSFLLHRRALGDDDGIALVAHQGHILADGDVFVGDHAPQYGTALDHRVLEQDTVFHAGTLFNTHVAEQHAVFTLPWMSQPSAARELTQPPSGSM